MPSDSVGVLVPADRIARVIGKAGTGLKQIRETTGVKLQVQQNIDPNAGTRRVDISGSIDQLAGSFALVIDKAFQGEPTCNPTILIPADKAGVVVGRGGENLKRVREECRVRTSLEREPVFDSVTKVQERHVQMQGEVTQMAPALRCLLGAGGNTLSSTLMLPMQRIPGIQNIVAPGLPGVSLNYVRPASVDPDEIQLHMCVPDKLAGAVLGKGGAQVKQTAVAAGCKVSVTSRDGTNDRRVVIIGSYSQCAIAQKLVYEQLTEAAHMQGFDLAEATVMFLIRKEAAGSVIGKQGSSLKQIREQSNTKIQLAREEVEGQRPCTITGTFPAVLQAEQLIFELVKNVPVESSPAPFAYVPDTYETSLKRQDLSAFAPTAKRQKVDEVEETTKLLVPAQAAGTIIGKQGSGLKQIRESYGVHVEMLQQAQAPHWLQDRVVILKGSVASRQAALEALLKVSFQMNGETCSLKLLVPSAQAGSVIGKQGNTLRAIREQCGISAQVEREEIMGERLVTAIGPLSQVSAAASAILDILENSIYANAGAVPNSAPNTPQATQYQFTGAHMVTPNAGMQQAFHMQQAPMVDTIPPYNW